MLYNQSTGKPEVLSLAGLTAWLETQDPQAKYTYHYHDRCLLAQYLAAQGYRNLSVYPEYFQYDEAGMNRAELLPFGMNEVAVKLPHTFGAALKRAHEIQGKGLASLLWDRIFG